MTTYYVSGPMSGLPESNYPAFNHAAARLRAMGYSVENPAECYWQPTWLAYMRIAVAKLARCDAIVMLPGWEASRGAKVEHALAVLHDLPVHFLDELLEVAA